MTQEQKELLLKDLCARLHYGVKVDLFGQSKELIGILNDIISVGYDINDYEDAPIEDIKPYLRPMWTMTIEEKKEYDSKRKHICDEYNRYCFDSIEPIDWLTKNHFDFRGLIPMGLALPARKNMYKII